MHKKIPISTLCFKLSRIFQSCIQKMTEYYELNMIYMSIPLIFTVNVGAVKFKLPLKCTFIFNAS